MKKQWKRASALAMAAAASAMLFGCAPSGLTGSGASSPSRASQAIQPSAPTAPTQPSQGTLPSLKPIMTEPSAGPSQVIATTEQIRLGYHGSTAWMGAFSTDRGCLMLATSVETLTDGLKQRGIQTQNLDLHLYDEAFFQENRLAVIPASSNSGSVRYQAELTTEGKTVHIALDAQMPPAGTSDMADWLVLVVLPLNSFDAQTQVFAPAWQGGSDHQIR